MIAASNSSKPKAMAAPAMEDGPTRGFVAKVFTPKPKKTNPNAATKPPTASSVFDDSHILMTFMEVVS